MRSPPKKYGSAVGHAQVPQRLPARRAMQPEQVDEVVVGTVEAQRGVGEDRKERDDPCAEHERHVRVVDVDQDERRDRDDRRHLQHDRIREEAKLDPLRLREEERERDASGDRRPERQERDFRVSRSSAGQQRPPVGPERLRDQPRPWQDVVRDRECASRPAATRAIPRAPSATGSSDLRARRCGGVALRCASRPRLMRIRFPSRWPSAAETSWHAATYAARRPSRVAARGRQRTRRCSLAIRPGRAPSPRRGSTGRPPRRRCA